MCTWTPCSQAFEFYLIGGVLGQVRSSSGFQILLCTEIGNGLMFINNYRKVRFRLNCIVITWGLVKLRINIMHVFTEITEIAQVLQQHGQSQQLLKVQVVLILNLSIIQRANLLIL